MDEAAGAAVHALPPLLGLRMLPSPRKQPMPRVQPRLRLLPEAAVAVNPWEPHSFTPGDHDEGSLFLVLYIKPIWFLDFGRSAQSALRFGRNEVEMTAHIRRAVAKVASLLLEDAPSSVFDGYLYELTQECFDQTWQWTPQASPLEHSGACFSDFRVRKSVKLMPPWQRTGSSRTSSGWQY